jgi:hypothetical protein
MTTSTTQVASASSATPASPGIAGDRHGLSFHDVLSDLNPLQYLPVVGTIYRAATGDVIPEPLRRLGSLLVSGLLGGLAGVAISLVTTVAEKITGVDPDKIAAAHFHPAATPAIASGPEVPAIASGPEVPAISPKSIGAPARPASARVARAPAPAERPDKPATVPTAIIAPAQSASARFAMTPAQLEAYGVRLDASGTLMLGDIRGADVLNTIEMGRYAKANAAYAAHQS